MDTVVEQRRHNRAELDVPLTFVVKGKTESYDGRARDVSVGGMFIETTTPAPFGSEVVISVRLPGGGEMSQLPARVRWGRGGGMGVQFGLLGAKETHLITELARTID
ncbi:MAG: PilZ domain-containing protein [Myxococcales bacterium]|jgi:Tfp pilus assembly protein PilZ|nr:PilZ domain-containing protein [Myxococcales bacterium]MBL9111116.1 PilZ domain-containing protein [Myxococcales bacterium]